MSCRKHPMTLCNMCEECSKKLSIKIFGKEIKLIFRLNKMRFYKYSQDDENKRKIVKSKNQQLVKKWNKIFDDLLREKERKVTELKKELKELKQ